MLRVTTLTTLIVVVSSSSGEEEVDVDATTTPSDNALEQEQQEEKKDGSLILRFLNAMQDAAMPQLPSALERYVVWFDGFGEEQLGFPHLTVSVLLGAVVATAIWLLLLPVHRASSRGAERSGSGGGGGGGRKKVLLVGPPGVGKTVLANQLCKGWAPATVTTMVAVDYEYQGRAGGKGAAPAVAITDFPGHERLRSGLRQALLQSKGVVFVLDGSDLSGGGRAAADLLFTLLTDPAMEKVRGLLIVANKCDTRVVKVHRVKAMLQRELEKLRSTRSLVGAAAMGEVGQDDDFSSHQQTEQGSVPLGRQNQPLDLEVDSPCPLTVATCSAKEGQLEAVSAFIASLH